MKTRIVAAFLLLVAHAVSIAAPTVNGNTISWPNDGWYQIQQVNEDVPDNLIVCEGGSSCVVGQGEYIVINHTTGERFEGIIVTDFALAPAIPIAQSPAVITPPTNLRLVIYSDTAAELFWERESNPFRTESTLVSRNGVPLSTPIGNSFFDNSRLPGVRYQYELVVSGPEDGLSETVVIADEGVSDVLPIGGGSINPPGSGFIIVENTITFADDGYYQVQNATTFTTACEGVNSCQVESGTYIVINHTTGERHDAIQVGVAIDPIIVTGGTIIWPDDGWYEVQDSTTYESLCNGTRFCRVPAGTYVVINHTTGERFQNIAVTSSENIERLILDRQWILTAVDGGSGIQIPVFQETGFEFTVSFGSNQIELGDLQGQLVTPIVGINVCNFYGGGYSLEGNVLNLLAVSEDSAYCERSPEMIPQLFGYVLFSASPPLLSIADDQLVITSGSNQKLYFSSQMSLDELTPAPEEEVTSVAFEGSWVLTEYTLGDGAVRSVPDDIQAESVIGIEVHSSEDLGVTYGLCESYQTSYRLDNNVLTTSDPVFPVGSCAALYGDDDNAERSKLLQLAFFNSKTLIAVSMNSLTVTTAQNGILIFDRSDM